MRDRRPSRRIASAMAGLLTALPLTAICGEAASAGGPVGPPGAARPLASEPALRPFHLNFNRFEIPYSVDQLGQQPVEVQLHVSRDAGASWQLYATQPVSGKPFLYEAAADGDYWFATRTVDRLGNSAPLRPQLAVRVDTTPPQADLQATVTPDGAIAATLQLTDAAPATEAIRIEYAVDDSGQWVAVPEVTPQMPPNQGDTLTVSAQFAPPASWQRVSLRALVGDKAGNKALVTQQLDRPRLANVPVRLATNKSPAPTPWAVPQFAHSSGLVPPVVPGFSGPDQSGLEAAGPELTAPLPPSTPPVNSLAPGSTADPAAAPLTPLAAPAPPPRPRTVAEALRPLGEPPTPRPAAALPNHAATAPSAPPVDRPRPELAASPAPAPASPTPAMNPADPPGRSLGSATTAARPASPASTAPLPGFSAPLRYSSSRQFSLEYEIESAGLAGVREVELWGTTDHGQTWKRWGIDPDRESPFDIETNNDGTYGFRIVVVASNGLATPRPLDGEPADILIGVDTQGPSVRITGATYGEAEQTGSLVIRYECHDENLARRPVSLAFSSTPAGPWSTIAAGLENTGLYVWPADPTLPRQIFLRIDAADLAGNVAHYVLDAPIDIQGLAPRARIRGFNPLTGSAGGIRPGAPPATDAAPAQTAKQPQDSLK